MIKFKSTKGVTLIALVVTIIVLLILAGITINMVAGQNGIMTKAKEAKMQTEIAEVKERARVDILGEQAGDEGEITKEKFVGILSKYFNDVPTAEDLPEDLSTVILTTKDEYGKNEIKISEIYDGAFGYDVASKKMPIEDLKVGDKVYYDTGNTNVGNKGIIECVVLYDSSSEYGVQVISSDIVGDKVTLGDEDPTVTGSDELEKAKNSYNRALTTLYNKAQTYLNPIYAIGSRCVGSNPEEPDWDSPVEFVGFKDQDYNYVSDWDQMSKIEYISVASDSYWLASRVIVEYSASGYLNLRHVEANWVADDGHLITVHSGVASQFASATRGFRPIITLKPGIVVTQGDGKNSPYTLATQ